MQAAEPMSVRMDAPEAAPRTGAAVTAAASSSSSSASSSRVRAVVGRAMVAVAVLGSTAFPPFVWFNGDHAGGAAWPIHARFHITWNACLVVGLGALAIAALVAWWEREPKIRVAVTALPVLMASTYVLAGGVVAPLALGLPDAYAERTPIVVFGHHTQFEGWILLVAIAVGGYLLDRRARRNGERGERGASGAGGAACDG